MVIYFFFDCSIYYLFHFPLLPTYITLVIAKLRSRIIMSCELCWVKEEGVIFYFKGNLRGIIFKSHRTT